MSDDDGDERSVKLRVRNRRSEPIGARLIKPIDCEGQAAGTNILCSAATVGAYGSFKLGTLGLAGHLSCRD